MGGLFLVHERPVDTHPTSMLLKMIRTWLPRRAPPLSLSDNELMTI